MVTSIVIASLLITFNSVVLSMALVVAIVGKYENNT